MTSKNKKKKKSKKIIEQVLIDLDKKHENNNRIKNIILTNQQTDLTFLKLDLTKYYLYYYKPYMLMDGKFFIPNYFSHIVLIEGLEHKLTESDILILSNMLNPYGTLTIPKKYGHLFKKLNFSIEQFESSDQYVNITKLSNSVYKNMDGTKSCVDCIVIGVQKASTTSALINLLKHKDIGGPQDEIHFFDIYWYKGIGYLQNQMNQFKNKKVRIIKNPDLIYLDSTFPLIQSVNPFIKFILFLRNPIDRAYSAWQMIWNNGWTKKNFEDSIEEELTLRDKEAKTFYTSQFHYLRRGLYWAQIKTFLKWFPKENLKIFVIEKYENHEQIYNQVYNFLNLDIPDKKIDYTKERVGSYCEKINPRLKTSLEKYFSKDIEKLEKFLGYSTGW